MHGLNKGVGYIANVQNAPKKRRLSVKNPLGPMTIEQLEAHDAKRIRKAPARVLPPSPNILSARLRERFAHLFLGMG